MNEQDLRDCFAMFASVGLIMRGEVVDRETYAKASYEFADAMLEARKPKEEAGIATVKRGRKKSEQ